MAGMLLFILPGHWWNILSTKILDTSNEILMPMHGYDEIIHTLCRGIMAAERLTAFYPELVDDLEMGLFGALEAGRYKIIPALLLSGLASTKVLDWTGS